MALKIQSYLKQINLTYTDANKKTAQVLGNFH